MKFKSQKGSVALFVLIALLFYMGFLLLLYANNLNKIQTISEKIEFVKSIYEKNINNIDDVYNRRFAKNDNVQPIIKDIPTKIITNKIESIANNVTKIEDLYEEYGKLGGKTDYIAFGNTFSSLKEVVNYANTNNLYGDCNIEINAYGNNGKKTTETKTVQIIKGIIVTNETELNTAIKLTDSLYIKIANNIECTNIINVDNINHTIDLNNTTISYTKQNESFAFITLGTNAALTILDTSNEKQGNITARLIDDKSTSDGNDRKNFIYTIKNNGILTLESGKIVSNCIQLIQKKNDGTNVIDYSTTIDNYGTFNLKGGTIDSNVNTQACTFLIVKSSESYGRGVTNNGIVNLDTGNIIVKAEASMVRGSLSTVSGKTHAYSYGIYNESGVVNNSNNIVFNVTAIANSSGTYSNTADKSDIKQADRSASE